MLDEACILAGCNWLGLLLNVCMFRLLAMLQHMRTLTAVCRSPQQSNPVQHPA